jgi:hypothetical protein
VLNRPVLKRVNLYGYFQNYKFIQNYHLHRFSLR